MQISHRPWGHITLALRATWTIFKANKVMKNFQMQGISNHPSMVGAYVLFLVANLEIGKADKLEVKIKSLKDEIKSLSNKIKGAKCKAAITITKAEKAFENGQKEG
eukprot:84979-Ditylum_brightwellii.AAC.1